MNNDSSPVSSVCINGQGSEPSTCEDSVGDNVGIDPQAAQNIIDFAAGKDTNTQDEIATEAGHWYLPDGTPFYTVPRASTSKNGKKGEPRPVNLRWDRKILTAKGAVPSVTTVTKILDKPGLNNYFERHIFDALIRWMREPENHAGLTAITMAPLKALDLDSLFKTIKSMSREHRDEKAARGTALHGEIERFLRGDLIHDKKWLPHIANLVRSTCQYGLNIRNGEPERSFANPLGFGGKVDYHETLSDGLVLDFKTKDTIEAGERYVYDEHAMQIAAYRVGLSIPRARGINIFVGEEDKKILIHEHNESDLKRGFEMFQLLLRFWKKRNNYYPKLKGNKQ